MATLLLSMLLLETAIPLRGEEEIGTEDGAVEELPNFKKMRVKVHVLLYNSAFFFLLMPLKALGLQDTYQEYAAFFCRNRRSSRRC